MDENTLKAMMETLKLVNKIQENAKGLKTLIANNPNTKVQIKNSISELSRQADLLDKKAQKWSFIAETKLEKDTPGKEVIAIGIQVDIPENKDERKKSKTVETREMATQTGEDGVQEIREEIKQCDSMDKLDRVISKEWPEEVFVRVRERQDNPLNAPPEYDMVIIKTADTNVDRGLTKQFRDRYPETEAMLKENQMGQGQMLSVTSLTRTKMGERETTNEKTCYLMDGGLADGKEMDTKCIYGNLKEVKDKMQGKGRKKLVVAWDSGASEKLKKLLEILFQETDAEVTVCVPKIRVQTEGTVRTTRKRQNETVLVKAEGKTYVELLKEMKNAVDIDAAGIQIAAMRKSRNGEMILEVNGESGAAEPLKKAIEEKIAGTNVRTRKRGKTIQIRDLDAVATQDEVREALRETLGITDTAPISLREAYGGNQVATVTLPEGDAQKALEMGRIRIGWLRCRVREQVDVKTCYRCWEAGHNTATCGGPDRSKLCLKCGKEGHRAKNCQEERFCPMCSQQGHRANTGGCPQFKKVLREARRKTSPKHK